MLFKLDENLPRDVKQLLHDSGHDALTVGEQQLNGRPDGEVAQACLQEGRVLVTLDLDFADIRSYPPAAYPGLVVLRLHTQDKPAVLKAIGRVSELATREEIKGCIWIVEDRTIRIRGGLEN